MPPRDEIPPGTLDMLILRTLSRRTDQHGFEIAESIRSASSDVLQVEEGSLYPALQRMLMKGWIAGEWSRTAENRRARYYRLTAAGRRQLEREVDAYRRVAGAIALILRTA
ncbi:MAG: PadR family transcriptional regulator [Gemmatimonadales bacterium]